MSVALVKELRDRTGLGLIECKKALANSGGDVDKAIEELRKSSGMKAAKKAGRTAADGVVVVKVAEDGSFGVIAEINSETDFAARDENFLNFANLIVEQAFATKAADIGALMNDELNAAREALVQKIGENINVRRVSIIEAPVVGSYVHGNKKIAVLTALSASDASVAKDVAMHVAAVNPQVVRGEDMAEDVLAAEKDIYVAQAKESGKPDEIIEKMIVGRMKKFLAENSLIEQTFVKDPDQTVGKLVKSAGAEVQSFIRFEVGEGIEVKEVDFAAEVAAQLNTQA